MSEEINENFDKYLRGEPVNEELAALKAGKLVEFEPFQIGGAGQQNQSTEPRKGEITRADRVALKELVAQPGWSVLHRLMENATLIHQESATLLSQKDPLANAQEIAQAWAYVNLHRQVSAELEALVVFEIRKLEEESDEIESAV